MNSGKIFKTAAVGLPVSMGCSRHGPQNGLPGFRRANWRVSNHRFLHGISILLIAVVPWMTGCNDFFITPCNRNNTCTSTTTTTGTGIGTDTGTGTGTGITPSDRSFLYTADAATGNVQGFSIGSGQIAPLMKPSGMEPSGADASIVAATPNNNLLFATKSDGSIFAYTIERDGSLQVGNHGQPVARLANPTAMATDTAGKLLFVASSSPTQLHVFQIDPQKGSLAVTVQGAISLGGGNVTQIGTTPDDRHLFVGLGTGGADVSALDAANGAVTDRIHISPLQPGVSKVNAIVSGNASRYLFMAESGQGIRVFSIGPNGTLKEISGSPFALQPGGPSSLVVDPANSVLYAAYSGSNTIAGYAIGSDGRLSAISTTSFSPESSPTALSLDASGKYLLSVANEGVGDPQMFSIDGNSPGTLSRVVPSVAANSRPAPARSPEEIR